MKDIKNKQEVPRKNGECDNKECNPKGEYECLDCFYENLEKYFDESKNSSKVSKND